MKGIFPVYKERGVYQRDVVDWITLGINFDVGVSLFQSGIKIASFPRLRITDEGLMHVSVGNKAPLILSNFKFGEHKCHVSGRLGHRYPVLVRQENSQETKDCSHVNQGSFQDALKSFVGDELQVRIPLEENMRSYLTELNRPKRIEVDRSKTFYEGTPPTKITVKNFDNISFNEEDKTFSFDVSFEGFLCLYRLVDDLGLKLQTFASPDRVISTQLFDIRAEDALRGYQLYFNEIQRSISKNEEKYKQILDVVNSRGRDIRTKMNCPWQMYS